MEYALELQDVVKTYRSRRDEIHAVSKVSFKVAKGSVFGFLGPNGAGKTTTMKMMVGLAAPTSGSITIYGHVAGSLQAARHIGYLPENPTLYRYLSALEYVTMHGQLAGLPAKKAYSEANTLLDSIGLKESKRRRIREYSKGMIQRTGLAQALIGNPDLLFLDEPFDGLDVLGRFEMKQLIHGLHKQKKTIFFNTHILSDVEEICDSIGIIDQGSLLESGPTSSFVKRGQTLEAYFVKRIEKQRGA